MKKGSSFNKLNPSVFFNYTLCETVSFVFLITVSILFLAFRIFGLNEHWKFLTFTFADLYYVDVCYSTFLLYVVLNFVVNDIDFTPNNRHKNTLQNDSPKYTINETEDILSYKNLVKNLKKVIQSDKHVNAFTIGIIGPWGNGKSSVINELKNELAAQNGIITVEFNPFLNHNENGIIDEFFNAFQIQLGKFSSQLSNKLILYSEQLIRFYKRGDIRKFSEINKNQSAATTYKNINKALEYLNKKIVVYIDDLDRLNGDEILQVLKLIRNTANFYNTFFVVAIDKNYVINAIGAKHTYQSQRFVDKFFQLEAYLPEIQNSVLVLEFLNILKGSSVFSQKMYKKVQSALNQNHCMFKFYIHNLRDVKRLANQIVFENMFIPDGLDYVDFLNFIMLKMRFPQSIDILTKHRAEIFTEEDGYFTLSRIENGNENPSLFSDLDLGKDFLKEDSYTPDLSQLEVMNEEKQKYFDSLNLSNLDKQLYFRTIYALWAQKKEDATSSISHIRNMNKLFRLTFSDDDLLPTELDEILDSNEDSNSDFAIKSVIDSGKGELLILKLQNIQIESEQPAEHCLEVTFKLLKDLKEHQFEEQDIFQTVIRLINLKKKGTTNYLCDNKTIARFFDVYFFDESDIDDLIKLKWLRDITDNLKSEPPTFRGISNQKIIFKSKQFWCNILKSNSNFSEELLRAYVMIYNIGVLDRNILSAINEELIDYVFATSLVSFCEIAIVTDGIDVGFYKWSNWVTKIWSGFKFFAKQIKEHKDFNKESEIADFLELSEIVKNKKSLRYEFNEIKPLSSNGTKKPQDILNLSTEQIIIEFANANDFNLIRNKISNPESLLFDPFDGSSSYVLDKKKYLFLTGMNKYRGLIDVVNLIAEAIKEIHLIKTDDRTEKYKNQIDVKFSNQLGPFVYIDNQPYVSIRSIQPKQGTIED